MPEPEPSQSADPELQLELPCPKCDYDLRGQDNEVCPECGLAFDRARMIEWSTRTDLPPWSNRQLLSTGSWPQLFFDALFAPSVLGRNLPPLISRLRLWRYAAVVRSLVLLPILAFFPMLGRGLDGVIVALIFISFLCSWGSGELCERVAARSIPRSARPTAVPSEGAPALWLGLVRCHASYLVATWIIGTLCVLTLAPAGLGWAALIVGHLVPLVWWTGGLSRAIVARCVEPVSRVRVAGGLFIVGAGAILFAYGVGFVLLVLAVRLG
jgi:hypothetical protein